jgi:hypothetical protein
MPTAIRYSPPSPQVLRNDVCYRTPSSADVLHGFLSVTLMADEEVSRRLEALDGAEVPIYELCPCPIDIVQQITNKTVLVLRNRVTAILVYCVNVVNDNGSVTSTYWNINGTLYTGDVTQLDLVGDNLNYGAAIVFCEAGINSVTRTDVWDEQRNLVAIIWQDMLGAIISEPTGALTPGSCELPLDTEIITQTDNLLENGRPSGRYVPFYRVNLFDNQGRSLYSNQTTANGIAYTPQGKVTAEPIVPPLVGKNRRITAGQAWEATNLVQSIAWAVEYANRANVVEITTPDSPAPVVYDRLNYSGDWSVDGSQDPYLQGIKITAFGTAKVVLSWTEQPLLEEVSPSVVVGSGY